jgi:hypothetical protein
MAHALIIVVGAYREVIHNRAPGAFITRESARLGIEMARRDR